MSSSNEVPGAVRRTDFGEPGSMADVDESLRAAVAASRESVVDGEAAAVPAVHVPEVVVAAGGMYTGYGVQASMDRRW